jgi:glutamate/tyrosine decarboxylase-like PLP-dependent enzyme
LPKRIGLGEPTTTVQIEDAPTDISLRLPHVSACQALEMLGEVDSIAVDPHKLGYIPYPAGAVCFKSNLVKPLARQEAPYLEETAAGIEAEKSSQGIGVYILEGSKPGAAAAAVWLSHSLIPLDSTGHGRLIQSTVRNATELYELLERYPDLVPGRRVQAITLCPPGSNIVCYAFRPIGAAPGLKSINELNQALYRQFTVGEEGSSRVYGQRFFISRTTLRASQYSPSTIGGFLERLEADPLEYEREGIFLLRSVLMNPWYEESKKRGRYVLSELVEELYETATQLSS